MGLSESDMLGPLKVVAHLGAQLPDMPPAQRVEAERRIDDEARKADTIRAGLEQEIDRLKTAMRLRDGELARQATRSSMEALQIAGEGEAPATVEREVLGTLLDVKLAELAYEDGMTLDQATRDICALLFAEQPAAVISAPVMLSAAIAAAHRTAVSTDMARKIEGTGKCMLAFRGDMPLEIFLERENLLDFLLWLRRLSKPHGKNHVGTSTEPRRVSRRQVGLSPTPRHLGSPARRGSAPRLRPAERVRWARAAGVY